MLKRFNSTQKSIDGFKRELAKLLKSIAAHSEKLKLPLFVMVDELDRCRPTYAIALLGRVKHLFEIDDVVFIVATDTKQLRHAIRAVYGESFDAEKYLYRFFDRTYRFEEPSRALFVKALLNKTLLDGQKISLPDGWTLESYLTEAFDFFNLPLRDCEQCVDIFRSVLTAWNIAFPLEMVVLLPLIIAFQQGMSIDPEELTSELNKLANLNRGNRDTWQFEFKAFHTHRGEARAERINGVQLGEKFSGLARKSFNEVFPSTYDTLPAAADCWVFDRLEREMNFLKKSNQRRIFSMVNDTAALVRSAGRLTPI